MIPSAMSVASVRLEPGYDQSGVAGAVVPSLSPRPAEPAHPLETTVLAVPPLSAELAEAPKSAQRAKATAMKPPEADPHQ